MKRILAILCAMACLFALALPAMAADKITVTAYVPENIEGWKIHFWGGSGPESTWPGVDMVKVENGVYKAEIDSGYTGFLIHSNENPKSADLSMSGTEDVWVVYDGTNASVHPTDPGKGAAPTPGGNTPAPGGDSNTGDLSGLNELYIVGTGMTGIGEWNTSDPNGKMTANGTTYTISLGLYKGTTIKFKFAGNGSWESGFNYGGESPMEITAGTPVTLKNDGGSGDLSYTATQDCNLTVTVDLAANTVKVEEVAGTPETPKPAPVEYPEKMYMIGQGIPGAAGDWALTDEAMAMSGKDGVYTIALELTAGTNFMFKINDGTWDVNFGGSQEGVIVENGTDVTLASGGPDLSYTAAADGTVTFVFDMTDNTLNVTAGEVEDSGDDNGNTTGDNKNDGSETTEPTTADNTEKKDEKKDNSTLIIILTIVGVVAAGTAIAVVLILKKK